jgi:hypothetical protein
VHRGVRVPSPLDRVAPPEVIGEDLSARLRRHAELRGARDDLLARLADGLPGELRSAAAALAKLAEDRLFGVGLGYASPDLYDDVLRWARRERVRPGRRPLDRAAVSLAKYAARAMAKPSPLTTFAASGLGRWASDAGTAVSAVRAGTPGTAAAAPPAPSAGASDAGPAAPGPGAGTGAGAERGSGDATARTSARGAPAPKPSAGLGGANGEGRDASAPTAGQDAATHDPNPAAYDSGAPTHDLSSDTSHAGPPALDPRTQALDPDPSAVDASTPTPGSGTAGSDLGAAVRLEGSVRVEVVEAGLLPLARIADALAHLPELDQAVRLRINPSATRVPSTRVPSTDVPSTDGDRWLFTAPGPSGEVRSLPATPALDAILEAARDAGTPAHLRALLVAAAADPGAGGQTDAVLARLVRLGLLECRADLPDQSLSAASLVAWLDAQVPAAHRSERLTLLRDDLRAIRDQAAAPPPSDPAAHRGIASAVRARTADAARRLGLIGPGDGLEQVTPYFHNTVVAGNAATLDDSSWHHVLADLALVPCLLAPFDALAPRRDALLHRAVAAYGREFRQPFTAVLRDFGAWWGSTTTAVPTERDAQRQAELRALLLATTPDADGTVRLPRDAVREVCGGWIDAHAAADRYTCYVQALAAPGARAGLGAVLNTVTCGHGTGRTRTARLLGAGTAGVRPHLAGPQSSPVYAEFDASFGSTLNQRARAVRYAIDLDGSCSARPPSRLIRPADLEVVHDAAAGRLRLEWNVTGQSVRPLHLGLLATPLLPLPARMLVEGFGQNSYTFWSDWPQLWQTATHGGAPGRVPRIALGSVVLRRARRCAGLGRRGAGRRLSRQGPRVAYGTRAAAAVLPAPAQHPARRRQSGGRGRGTGTRRGGGGDTGRAAGRCADR